MKRRKESQAPASSEKSSKKDDKGSYHFVKIFAVYLVVALIILVGIAAWRYANKVFKYIF